VYYARSGPPQAGHPFRRLQRTRSHEASSEFGDAPWVVKPVPFEMLLKSLQAAMA
jgi:hypothetical protein